MTRDVLGAARWSSRACVHMQGCLCGEIRRGGPISLYVRSIPGPWWAVVHLVLLILVLNEELL